MNDLYIYLLKVSAGLGIIAMPYLLLFRDDPNLLLKRFYLMLGLAASWIAPLMAFSRPEMILNLTPTVFIDPAAGESIPLPVPVAGSDTGITINWIVLLIMVYISGLAFMVIKNLVIILKWNLTWQKTETEQGVVFTQSDQVFTIFTRIFVPGSLRGGQDLDNILLHEKAHVEQLHFIDLILMELTLLLTWFNPFSWLISRMIKENHEHLADRQVLSAGVNPARYRAQLLNHTLGVNVFRLGNQFNHSLTLKRFKMMKKPRRSPRGIIKIAMLIPAVLVTMGLATGMTPQQKTVKGKVVFADTGEPATGASVIIAGTTMGTVADHEGTFHLNVDGDPEIVISFVGYTNLSVKASDIGKRPLKMKVEPFYVELKEVPVAGERKYISLQETQATDRSDQLPVYVLDGKVIKDIDEVDPETIEKIEVVKDPDTEIAQQYNAKNAVVIITTKQGTNAKGKKNQQGVEVKGYTSQDEEVFFVVEDMPQFPGGKSALKTYIYSKLDYPADMKKRGISGEVQVQFLVTTSGKLEDIKAISSSDKAFEAPALEVFESMPDWKPGIQRGKPVKVQVVVPVRFNAGVE
ncbi:MAG: TonB family protein [Bacteroidota bacterium]